MADGRQPGPIGYSIAAPAPGMSWPLRPPPGVSPPSPTPSQTGSIPKPLGSQPQPARQLPSLPPAGLTPAIAAFITEWAAAGRVARDQDLPVGSMLACASVESGWGTGNIYKGTGNPFNLQKWPRIRFPHTHKTYWHRTKIAEGPPPKFAYAPFNCATDPADAVLQWCEWIVHWGRADGPGRLEPPNGSPQDNPPAIANRDYLLSYRRNSQDFCMNLPLVGFGENATAALRLRSGERYRKRLVDFRLYDYD
jgi:hypothetical protein